jgi:hypothetical protein
MMHTHSLAEAVDVFYSKVIHHLRDSLRMTNFHMRWVPRDLAADLHRCRLEICGRLLPILEASEPDSYRMLITGNES